ncbi:hypothetical protein EMIT0P265_30419 [Pseudomonas zeae]
MPLHVSPIDPRWLPSYTGLTNMSENSSYDWMKGRILCQTFLHLSNDPWSIRPWISFVSASTAVPGRLASVCRPNPSCAPNWASAATPCAKPCACWRFPD